MEYDRAKKKKGLPCPRCGNPLRVRPDQIGSQVMCPKCNSTFTVAGPGTRPSSAASSADDDAYEPEVPLARSPVVPDEMMVDLSPSANQQAGYDVDWSAADDIEMEAPHERPAHTEPDYLAGARARGFVRDQQTIEPPTWTFFSGVFAYPWQGANLGRWVAIAFGLTVTGEFFVATVAHSGGGLGTLMMPILSMISAVMTLLSLSFLAPCFLAAIQDTADGFDEVQESTMPEWDQWFFSFLSVLSVWVCSGLVGFPFSFVEQIGPIAILISSFLFFPVLLLSALECESFLIPFSPPVLASLSRMWWAWLVFYLLAAMLLGGWFVITGLTIAAAPYLMVLVLAPALAAVLLIYARLIGRLGWLISGAPLGVVERRDDERPGSAKPRRGKRRRMRIVLPADFDAGARLVIDDKPPSTPISSQSR